MASMTDTFDVPQAVRDAAKRGLEMRRKYGRGGLDTNQAHQEGVGSGVQRASDLISGKVTYRTIKRMVAFFSRHRKNKDSRMDNGEPGAGMIAWAIWGGDAGDRWSRSVVQREENVKKGTLTYTLMFGDVDEDAPVVEDTHIVKARTFAELLAAARPTPTIPLDNDPDTDVMAYDGLVVPMEPPADAIAPSERPLSMDEVRAIADAETDEEARHALEDVTKAVVDIDLMEDYVQPAPKEPEPDEVPTDPAPPVQPELQVVVTSDEHSALKKIVKSMTNMPKVDKAAKDIAKHIMRGDWAKIDMDLVCGYLFDDSDLNSRAVGGSLMLSLICKAQPKVPQKYLEGAKDPAARKRFIQNRVRGKHTGDKYKDFPGDKGAETKPSKYTRTELAAKVREEIKGPGKDEFLRALAKVSGISKQILEQVYQRGSEAWATSGHRVGASQEAWARARCYSFASGGKTRTTADADLWRKHKGS